MAAVIIHSNFRAQEEEICHCFHLFPFCLPWSDGTRYRDLSLVFNIEFKPTSSFSSFTLIKRLFNSSLLSAIRVVSSTYLRLFLFFPPILILACNLSSPAFLKMCSVYRLNKQQMTADNPVILVSQSWTNQLFHTKFYLLLLDPHIGFSGDR